MFSLNHKFSKESESSLKNFLKAAESQKMSSTCDLEKYESWKKLIEDDSNDVATDEGENTIDLTRNDEVSIHDTSTFDSLQSQFQELHCHESLTESIRERLEISENVPEQLLNKLNDCPSRTVQEAFKDLSRILTNKQIKILGESLNQVLKKGSVLECFCKIILAERISANVDEDLKVLFSKFCDHSPEIIVPQAIASIHDDATLNNILNYLGILRPETQGETLRLIIKNDSNFEKKHIHILDALINEHVDYDCLAYISKILEYNCDQYESDKDFGKLLLKIMKYFGEDLSRVETILCRIISSHKSIWKKKLQKTLDDVRNKMEM